ncbi:hypothetical protein CN03_10830 [Thalassolituus oleivorans]|jgi:hypothetical protein|uniref:hypothetical protein n=1 Tax=Thalassolituus oleivorans TaxID=187493 RepID=UPI000949301E|nr:hypothetical protein [Thalassolituus oleivorans]APR67378.1 hypothetical protein CN03_10830 [Thalassolituus oleivorans]
MTKSKIMFFLDKEIFRFPLVLLISGLAIGCSAANDGISDREDGEYSTPTLAAQWTDAFVLPGLLADDVMTVSQQDIQTLFTKKWYASIDVKNTLKQGISTLSSCEMYFNNKTSDLRAIRDNEQSAFLELTSACEAGRLISNAAPSSKTYLPKQIISNDIASQLPKNLAFVTSKSEWKSVMTNASKQYWADINTIVEFERLSDYQAAYLSDGGKQVLSEIARGDFNSDGYEDVLLKIEDSLEGGSYSNIRLFGLTITVEGKWRLLAQY